MRLRPLDLAYLLLLAVFILAGMPLASFHGDEAMQIYMSHDYARLFIYGDPESLKTRPPYDIDSDPQLRILNGSVNRYAIGVSWHLAGFTNGDLPPRPGWDWGLSYERNVETNHRPPEALLNVSRLSSTLFLALSAWAVFALGWRVGGGIVAYLASLIYTLNPVILLNGRRAMQEGAMLFFGVGVVLVAALISHKRAVGERVHPSLWGLLALAGGLALTSKHSAAVFVVGALGWIAAGELTHFKPLPFLKTIGTLVVVAALTVGLFVALSPALWEDTPTRMGDLLAVRAELLDIQVAIDPDAPISFARRIEEILAQPFLRPPLHYEMPSFAESPAMRAEVDRYIASPLSGLQFGVVLGVPLTLCALLGVGLMFTVNRAAAAGLLVWLGVVVASLLLNPLPWQRYYLPLIPVVSLLAAVGVWRLAALLHRRKT